MHKSLRLLELMSSAATALLFLRKSNGLYTDWWFQSWNWSGASFSFNFYLGDLSKYFSDSNSTGRGHHHPGIKGPDSRWIWSFALLVSLPSVNKCMKSFCIILKEQKKYYRWDCWGLCISALLTQYWLPTIICRRLPLHSAVIFSNVADLGSFWGVRNIWRKCQNAWELLLFLFTNQLNIFTFFFFPPYHKSKPEVTNHPEEFPNSFRGIRFFHHCGALKVIVWIYQITAVGKKVECIVSVQRESYSKKTSSKCFQVGMVFL